MLFWDRVTVTGFCWEWNGHITPEGYGTCSVGGTTVPVHRHAWWLLTQQEIPAGMQIDHLCRTRNCVNPDHLEVVTPRENSIRAQRYRKERTACVNGHSWNERDQLATTKGVYRSKRCRQCLLVRSHRTKGLVCSYSAFCSSPSHESRERARQTCSRGHSMEDAYIRPDGWKNCRTCQRMRARKEWRDASVNA